VKILLVLPFVLVLCSCQTAGGKQFIEGFTREATSQLAEASADALDKKLGDEFKGLTDTVRGIPAGIPQGPGAGELGLLGTLGMLAAKLIGDSVKGAVRSKFGKKDS
jgi:hypothetical protein